MRANGTNQMETAPNSQKCDFKFLVMILSRLFPVPILKATES